MTSRDASPAMAASAAGAATYSAAARPQPSTTAMPSASDSTALAAARSRRAKLTASMLVAARRHAPQRAARTASSGPRAYRYHHTHPTSSWTSQKTPTRQHIGGCVQARPSRHCQSRQLQPQGIQCLPPR